LPTIPDPGAPIPSDSTPHAPSPDGAVGARATLPANGLPADGLRPDGTPVPPDAAVPLAELDAGAPAAPHAAPTGDGHADVGAGPDVLGAVGLPAKLRAVLRIKDFRKLWLSMSLSSFGDWLGLLAITATATSLVHGFAAANFALGGVLLFRLLPAIVLGPLAGAFADRFDRRKTMVVTDVIRFSLFASIPLVDNLVWLFVAQFLIEAFSLFWIPAKEAAVPNMLRKDQLEPANQLSLSPPTG